MPERFSPHEVAPPHKAETREYAWGELPEDANEMTRERLARYRSVLEDAAIDGWRLMRVGQSIKYGASAYGYFTLDGSPDSLLKIRLSDHGGRWSGYALDVRHQPKKKMRDTVQRFMKERAALHRKN